MAKPAAAGEAKPKLGWSTRLQMYVVIMGSYYAYKAYTGKDAAAEAKAKAQAPESIEGCKEGGEPKRRFTKVGGSYLSSLEAGTCADVQLLLLVHQTSLSAETEFGAMLPQLATPASDGGIPGLRVVALDRPCHGYSPCIEGSEPDDASALFGRLLVGRRGIKHFAFMTSGRDAARHALATVQRSKMVARMLLIRPQLVVPDVSGLNRKSATVDSTRWAVLNGGASASTQGTLEGVAKLPRGCTVTLMYIEGDVEDDALKAALEDADAAVEVRYVDSLEEGVVPAVTDMLASDGAATEDEI